MIWKRHTKLKLLTLVAVLIVLIAAGYLMWGGRAFTARNLAAEQKFEELIQSSPGKDQLLEKLHPAGFRVSTWGKPPDEYYVVYRQVETPFDLLSDRYYMYTNRGSRRLTGLLFFGADDQVTSYTISSQPGSKYAEKAP